MINKIIDLTIFNGLKKYIIALIVLTSVILFLKIFQTYLIEMPSFLEREEYQLFNFIFIQLPFLSFYLILQ